MRSILLNTLLILLLSNCRSDTNEEALIHNEIIAQPNNEIPNENVQENKSAFSLNVFEVAENQYGYDILVDGKTYIHQPHMPAVGGNNGFSSKEKAEVAGNYVIYKLMNNIVPPTVNQNELDSLGVLN